MFFVVGFLKRFFSDDSLVAVSPNTRKVIPFTTMFGESNLRLGVTTLPTVSQRCRRIRVCVSMFLCLTGPR